VIDEKLQNTSIRKYTPYQVSPETILFDNPLAICSVIISREAFRKAGFFDESLEAHEDWDYWIRVSRHFPILSTSEITCEARFFYPRNYEDLGIHVIRKHHEFYTADNIFRGFLLGLKPHYRKLSSMEISSTDN
jgi:hypothetical protein